MGKTMHLSSTVMEIWHLKDNGVTSLTFWGHVGENNAREEYIRLVKI